MKQQDFDELHQELADRLEHIQLLMQAGDGAEIARQLHSLKGLAKAYGLVRFASEIHAAEDTPEDYVNQDAMTSRLDVLYRLLDDIGNVA